MKVAPIAAAFVAYIVLGNLSLNVNPVSFYQVMKIAVAPTVMALELAVYGKLPTPRVVLAVMLVCLGVAAATITDTEMASNLKGLAIGASATLVTAMYQIWAGTKQRELKASSMQLLHQYTPQATLMLGMLIPLMEPVGLAHAHTTAAAAAGSFGDGTLLGYHYTPAAVAAILLSAVLGLLVSLSTFLVIGATSSLTYNVVGHVKTVLILTGGCLMFGDTMPPKKLAGIGIAMVGIIWYSLLQLGASGSVSPAGPTMGPNAQSAAGKAPSSDGGIRRPLLPVTDTKAAVLAASGCCSSDNAVVLDQLDSER